MFCKECGNQVVDKAVVCPKCGSPVGSKVGFSPVGSSVSSSQSSVNGGGSGFLFGSGYVFAILIPIVGLILGICSCFRSSGHGIAIIALSVISWIFWACILLAA